MKIRKNKFKWIPLITACMLLLQTFTPLAECFVNKVNAASVGIVYNGNVTYGGSTVGDFTVDGQTAFCIEHDKPTPPTGTSNDGGSLYDNPKIRAALYWGWDGAKSMFTNRNQGIVVTSLVLSQLYSGTTSGQNLSGFAELMAKAQSEDVPDDEIAFSKTSVNSSISGNVQKSETITLNAASGNSVTFTLPNQVMLYNVTTGQSKTGGSVTIDGGQLFYLTAPLTYSTDFNSGNLKGSMKKFQPILYKMSNSALQTLAGWRWTDPEKTISFTAKFQARMGDVEITKRGSDGKLLAGAEYEFKDSTGKVAAKATTGSNGKDKVTNLLVGEYTVVETKAPAGYTLDYTPRKVTVNAGQTATLTVTNKQAFLQIRVKKQDAETGDSPQGDATLKGAKYGIYADKATTQLLDEVTIGDDLTALSKQIPLEGASRTVYIKETKDPTGYQLDTTVYEETVNQSDTTTEVFVSNKIVKDEVIKGLVAVQKYWTPDPNLSGSGALVGLPNAVFQLIHNATGKIVETIKTNAEGYAKTGEHPYGHYILRESQSPAGTLPVDDIQVFIDEHGRTYNYTLYDANVTGVLKIVKVDGETGKTIPAANVQFKVWDMERGRFITIENQDVFKTDDSGEVYIPVPLRAGKYAIYEQSAPEGYVLSEEPIPFEVKEDAINEHGVVTVKFENQPQKGIINITKTGEMLVGVKAEGTKFGDLHSFIFNQQALEGVTFDVIAKEDIKTADGTIRYKKGEKVDTVTTPKDGKIATKPLYLGKYQVVEVKSPAGYVFGGQKYDVELKYAGQEVEITSTSTTIKNVWQQLKLMLEKHSEDNVPLEGVVYGIYNAEDMVVDGKVILEKDSLVGLTTTDKNGIGTIKNKYPEMKFYAKELQTIPNYVLDATKHMFEYKATTNDEMQTLEISKEALVNKAQRGTINITKTGEMLSGVKAEKSEFGDLYSFIFNQQALEGVTFDVIAKEDIYTLDGTLQYKKGEKVDTVTTLKDGKVSTKPLHLGKYQLVEVKAPAGYVLSGQKYDVELTYEGQTVEITSTSTTIKNKWQQLKLMLEKHSEDNVPLEGVVYGVYNSEDIVVDGEVILEKDSLVGLTTTDKNGIGTVLKKYPEMKFYAQELQTIPNYVLDKTKYPFHFEATNNDSTQPIVISKDTLINKAQRGVIEITKTGEMLTGSETAETEFGDLYNFLFNQQVLEGVTFDVIAKEDICTLDGTLQYKEGEKVDKVTTGENGKTVTEPLHLGKYQLVEVAAPSGYILNGQTYDVTLTYAGQHVEITSTSTTIENTIQEVDLKLNKVAEVVSNWDNGSFETRLKPIEGIVFGIYTREAMEVNGEEIIPANALIALTTTDEEGIARLLKQFPEGKYFAKELQTTEEHMLLQDEFDFELTYQDNNESLEINIFKDKVFVGKQNLNKMARNPIENELFTNFFSIHKEMQVASAKDESLVFDYESGKISAGNEFTVWNIDGEVVDTLIIDEEGNASSIPLPVGTYTFQETKVGNENYKLNSMVYTVKITKDSTVITDEDGNIVSKEYDLPVPANESEVATAYAEVIIQNDLILNEFQVNKLAEMLEKQGESWKSHYDRVSKVEFTLKDENDEIVSRQETDKKGEIIFKDLPIGKYFLEETKAASEEYRENTTVYEVTVTKDAVTIKDSEGNIISKEDSVTIKNHLKRGEVEISKQDVTREEELPGATLNVKGEEVDITWVSTDEPKKLQLKDGEYTLTEILPNDGYQLNTEVITFVVKDGETTKVVMHNKKLPEEVKTGKLPQAGDTLTGILLITGASLLVGGAAMYVIRRKKNKES